MRKNRYHDGAADAARHLSSIVSWLVREVVLLDAEKIGYASLSELHERLRDRLEKEEEKFRDFGDPACAAMSNLYETLIFYIGTDAKTKAKSRIGVLNMSEKGHIINTGGSAIITIEAVLKNVTQTIGTASGLDSDQKSHLDSLVKSLRAEMESLESDHPDEARAIAVALDSAVANASKPKADRRPNLLQFTAKGLKEAAELVRDVAPNVLITADLIAKFILGL